MKSYSNQAFRCATALAFGAVLIACGDDPEMMMSPIGQAGASGGVAMPGPGTPAAGGGAAGSVAGSSAGAGAAGRASGAAGRAAAGNGAAGMTSGAAGAIAGAGAGAAGMGTAGTPPAAGAGAGGAAAGAGAGASGTGGAGSSAAGSGGGAAGSSGGAAGSTAAGATFTQVYGLIMAGCSCHVSNGAGGLSMANKLTAYTNLVGVNSGACSGQKRVVAGQPDMSVLYHSIERTNLGNCQVPRMPSGGAMWSATDIATVKSWIMAGAMND